MKPTGPRNRADQHPDDGSACAREERDAFAILVPSLSNMLMRDWEHDRKNKAEARLLPAQATIRALVHALPAPWLAAVAKVVGSRARRKPEREVAVAQALGDAQYLRHAVEVSLGEDERHLLDSVLCRGGIEKASTIMRRYGSDESDGWFWVERPPRSTLGRVRLQGLAFVGTATICGRRHRMLVIPEELRAPLRAALTASRDPRRR